MPNPPVGVEWLARRVGAQFARTSSSENTMQVMQPQKVTKAAKFSFKANFT